MSPLMTCSNRGGHSQPLSICALREDSGFDKANSPSATNPLGVVNRAHIDYADKEWRIVLNLSPTLSQKDKKVGTNILWEEGKQLLIIIRVISSSVLRGPNGKSLDDIYRNESSMTSLRRIRVLRCLSGKCCKASKDISRVKKLKKKRKPVSESSEAPPLAKRAKAGKGVKKRTVKSSKQLVDEFVDEGVPAAKPRLEDTEEAILQKVLEESLTDTYPTQRGPLPPVVLRETDTGKLIPLPEVLGKGKEKRRTPVPSQPAGHEESSSLYAELGLSGSDTESDEEMPSVVRSGAQDEG
ncbi:hypothetical protein Tco_0644318 [Tanacetum coccineum]